MNFHQDIRDHIKAEFSYLNIDYTPSPDINQDLLKLFTIQQKFIYPIPRTVKVSKELQEKISGNHKHSNEIIKLQQMLQEGEDVNPHQTTELFNFHVHDHLVYDWKIYHLHLSFDKNEISDFTGRTKEILFVYITKDLALLLDVCKHPPHDVFANKFLLEIIDNNWSDILLPANGITALSMDPTPQDRFGLRKHNLNEGILEVNGKFIFSPGFGQVASGHSAEEAMKLNAMNRWLRRNEEAIISNRETIDEMFMQKHKLERNPAYKIVFTEQGPQIWDEVSETCLVKYGEVITFNKTTS